MFSLLQSELNQEEIHMTYQEQYQQKLTTAAEAVKVVKSGDWVDYTWCTNHPIELDKEIGRAHV